MGQVQLNIDEFLKNDEQIKESIEKYKKNKNDLMCSVCCENPKCILFSCGHIYACKKCSESVNFCGAFDCWL